MKLKRYLAPALMVILGGLLLSGCDNKSNTATTDPAQANTIKVGVIAGAELKLADVAKKVAKQEYGLNVQLVVFNDYVLPNEALNNKEIDLNAFQTKPFLDQQIKDYGYQLVPVAKTFIYPIAGYSTKIKSIDQLATGATIAIPDDPTNAGRALLLLQQEGLIKLRSDVGFTPTPLDIIDNPKKLNIIEIEAPQLTRVLDDPKVSIAIINGTYASQLGLTPSEGLFVENKDSPYVNYIVARPDNKESKAVQEFVKSYQSQAVIDEAKMLFKGQAIPGWQ